ncbi:hypothetical protein ALT721_800017 [Alteromonas alvinellae]
MFNISVSTLLKSATKLCDRAAIKAQKQRKNAEAKRKQLTEKAREQQAKADQAVKDEVLAVNMRDKLKDLVA